MPSRKHTKNAAAICTEKTRKTEDKDTLPHPMNVCNGVWSSVVLRKDEHGTDSVQRHEWDQTSLRPYAHFKKLYGERKYSKPHSTTPMHCSFLDLPAELRNRVYRLALINNPTYIELSAKTTQVTSSNGHAQIFHLKRYRHKILPTLRLLRTCKQIQKEAASIFYGEHEFRFTSVRGIYILERFLFTIGASYNVSCIRKLAMHITIPGNTEDDYKENLRESNGTMAHMARIVHGYGLRRPHYNWGGNLCEKRIKEALEGHGKLTEFTLIMPDTFRPIRPMDDPSSYSESDFFIDPAAFGALKIRLVRLHGGFAYYRPNGDPSIRLSNDYRDRVLPYHLGARKYARRMGYEVLDVAYDKLGHWPVALEDGDEIRKIEGDDAEAD